MGALRGTGRWGLAARMEDLEAGATKALVAEKENQVGSAEDPNSGDNQGADGGGAEEEGGAKGGGFDFRVEEPADRRDTLSLYAQGEGVEIATGFDLGQGAKFRISSTDSVDAEILDDGPEVDSRQQPGKKGQARDIPREPLMPMQLQQGKRLG